MSIKDFFKRKEASSIASPDAKKAKTGEAVTSVETSLPPSAVTDEIEFSQPVLEEGAKLVSVEEMNTILSKTHTSQPAPGTGPASIWNPENSSTKKPASSSLDSPFFSPDKDKQYVSKSLHYALLSDGLSLIENTKNSGAGSKKKIIVILTNVFRLIIHRYTKEELVAAVFLFINRLAPDFENLETNVGDQIVLKTIAEVYGRSEDKIKQSVNSGEAADFGEAALLSRVSQTMLFTPPPLTVSGVFKDMHAIAKSSGKDSQRVKKDIIKKMLVAGKGQEAKYLIRTLQGRLRVGIQNASVLQALSYAFALTDKTVTDRRGVDFLTFTAELEMTMVALEAAVKQAFCEVPDFNFLLKALHENPFPSYLLEVCQVRPGVPVKPMLAKPTKAITEVLDRFEGIEFTAEYKYDGERAQVHILNGGAVIQVYSRNSENMTEKYPDVVSILKQAIAASPEDKKILTAVIDCECVAFDREENRILPFQTLSTRSRKNVTEENVKVTVCLFPFDLIYLNGVSMVREPLRKRRSLLQEYFVEIPKKLQFAVHKNLSSSDEIQEFLNEAVEGACEGLMLKTLDVNASYEPSKRSLNWLKLKKDYIQGMGDSVDLVPIGAFYGRGKRTGAYGAFLLAAYDADNGEFQTVCKIGTGFSDEDLSTHYKFFKDGHIIPHKRNDYDVIDRMYPDVWFDAVQVWEVAAADLSISPVHTAGRSNSDDGKGIGLRFPRFIRIRDDKSPEDATNTEQIASMYSSQFANKQKNNELEDDEDE
jgi:DNA ligase 1